MDDPIDLRVSTIGRVHPNNEVPTYYFIEPAKTAVVLRSRPVGARKDGCFRSQYFIRHWNSFLKIWMLIKGGVASCWRADFQLINFITSCQSLSSNTRAFSVSGDRTRDAQSEIKTGTRKSWISPGAIIGDGDRKLVIVPVRLRSSYCSITVFPEVWCKLKGSRPGTRLITLKFHSKYIFQFVICCSTQSFASLKVRKSSLFVFSCFRWPLDWMLKANFVHRKRLLF